MVCESYCNKTAKKLKQKTGNKIYNMNIIKTEFSFLEI